MDSISSKFNAAASAAGYLFQARLALAEALRYAYSDSGIEIGVEKLDDISFEQRGEPLELLQTKHHIAKAGDLTNASPDLWRTIRIWSERVRADPSLPSRVRFTLVTTSTAPQHSAAALLRPDTGSQLRDVDSAVRILAEVASTSQNSVLEPAFSSFLALAPAMRKSLLDAVDVLDRGPTLVDLGGLIEERLKMIAPRGKAPIARELIEGWWWGRIAKALLQVGVGTISVLEVEARLDDLREVMKRDSLPIDQDETDIDQDHLAALDEMNFVKQLRLVYLGAARIELAKRDFYRASTQRSRWTRESLVFDGEISQFEKLLVEEWQPRFHAMCDGLAARSSATSVRKAGQELYRWVETEARFPFRSALHRFLCVGSYNMLANDLRVGWHRDFSKKLSSSEEE